MAFSVRKVRCATSGSSYRLHSHGTSQEQQVSGKSPGQEHRGKGEMWNFPSAAKAKERKGTLSTSTSTGLEVQAPLGGTQDSSPQGKDPPPDCFPFFINQT